MTTQIPERIAYQGDYYIIANWSLVELYTPQDFGMKPRGCGSALWRGFHSLYEVVDKHLLLKDFVVCTGDEYLPIAGKMPSADSESYFRGTYRNLNLNYRENVNLILLRFDKLYNSSEIFPIYSSVVKGLHFEQGILIEEKDYSIEVKQLRRGLR